MDHLAPEYVAARRVLLDALDALQDHLDNLVLVGAQAVYHHTGSADLNVPLMTTDADLAVNTHQLADAPEIDGLLQAAGFTAGPNPGHWVARSDIAVDLMVVPHQAGTTKASARAAKMAPHGKRTARIARGLEPALVDNEIVTIVALEPGDARTHDLRLAGSAALLTAKAIKIEERLGQADRQTHRVREKDALDLFRLLQAIEVPDLVRGFKKHGEDEHAAVATDEALVFLREHGATPQGDSPSLLLLQLRATKRSLPLSLPLSTNCSLHSEPPTGESRAKRPRTRPPDRPYRQADRARTGSGSSVRPR